MTIKRTKGYLPKSGPSKSNWELKISLGREKTTIQKKGVTLPKMSWDVK